MRIVIAPDSYKGSVSALGVAQAMKRGIRRVFGDAFRLLLRRQWFLRNGCILALLLFSIWPTAQAQNPQTAPVVAPSDPVKVADQQAARRQTLLQDQQTIAAARSELESRITDLPWLLESLPTEQVDQALVEKAQVDLESARLRQQSVVTELDNAYRRVEDLKKTIADLEAREQLLDNPAKDAAVGAAERTAQLEQTRQLLAQQRVELELETLSLANLRAQVAIARQRLNLVEQAYARVEQIYRQHQEQSRQDAQTDLVSRLQNELKAQQDRAAALKQRLTLERSALPFAAAQRLETELQTVEEQVNLLNRDRHLAEVGVTLGRLKDLLQEPGADPEILQSALETINDLRAEVRRDLELLQQKTALYEQQRQVIEKRDNLSSGNRRLRDEELRLVNQLLTELNRRISQVQEQGEEADQIEAALDRHYRERLHQDFFTRKPYPGTAEAWQHLWSGLTTVPQVLWYQVRLSVESAIKAMLAADALRWIALIALESGLCWLLVMARRALRRAWLLFDGRASENGSFLRELTGHALLLTRSNLLGLGAAMAMSVLLWLVQAPQPGLGILLTLTWLWVGIKLPISLAWLILASPHLPEPQRQPTLYRQLFWTQVIGSLLIALMILAHLSDLPESIVIAFERLFMLYWFWAFMPVLRIRRLVMDRLGAIYGDRFWFLILRFFSLSLPLSLLGAAVLGLLGYLRLAWMVAGYLLIFIAILVGWILSRSLLNDLAVALKNYAVAHSGYGLLWTQDIIKPLHRIMNLLLFLSAWVVLFRAYGWTGQSAVLASIWGFLEQPLLHIGGAAITLWGIITTLTILLVVIWLGQWGRAITYRWVLSQISDMGVRHSLSVFTQYAIVLIGLLIILRIIGIDLTTLAVFAGAVGVGIGLGMQSLANNFVSGLLLLIERPLRSGDLVRIGEYEGEVMGIGMRSLTVKTFDNQSVIIPNSEVVGNAFTNWTHNDRILRTLLVIGIGYDCDPQAAKQILENVLADNEGVLTDPAPQVLFWEFADSAMLFRVYYHVDIGRASAFKVRDQVMLTIWRQFKQAGITIPFPQRELHIRHSAETQPTSQPIVGHDRELPGAL
jgi:potassium efflux system protein